MGKSRRTASRQAKVLEALERGADVTEAAEYAGASRSSVYVWWRTDAEFRDAANAAIEFQRLDLVAKGYQLAMGGSERLLVFMIARAEGRVARVAGQGEDGVEDRVGVLEIVGLEEAGRGGPFIEFVEA